MEQIDTNHLTVKVMDYFELNSQHIQQWAELEDRAVESNAYLSPYFLMPAVKHLTPRVRPMFVFVEEPSRNEHRLCGVGVFHLSLGTKRTPFPHLKAYLSPHSYLSGLLVDTELIEPTVKAFFSFFCKSRRTWYGVEFLNLCKDTSLAYQLDKTASLFHVQWYENIKKTRAFLILKDLEQYSIETSLSAKRKKNYHRCQRFLEDMGKVNWQVVRGQQIGARCIDTFLHLEDAGWKREQFSSLKSKPNHEAFFREMIEGFAKNGRAFFTELSVNSEVIASTSNIISGKAGFAFKVGWHPEFSKMSPGILNEIEFLKKAYELFSDLQYIDSGAEEGSFIETLWPNRRVLISGFYATSPLIRPIIFGIGQMRHVVRYMMRPLRSYGWH